MSESMSLATKVGSYVVYTGEGGYAMERYFANKKLTIGQQYQVKDVRIGSWSSGVLLEEGSFNTAMFANVGEDFEDDVAYKRRVAEFQDMYANTQEEKS